MNKLLEVDEQKVSVEIEPLSLSARCDATSSGVEQSFTRFRNGDQTLELCGHHANKHEIILMASGWTLEIDNRNEVNARPSPSANVESGPQFINGG